MGIFKRYNQKMQRIIILEGPDNCGKTHIGQALSKHIGVPYFKNTGEWDAFLKRPEYFVNTLIYAESYFTNYLKQSGASVILDRGFPSEWVYSRAFQRKTDHSWTDRIDKAYADLGAKIIVCHRTDYSQLTDDLFPDKIDSTKLAELDELYMQFMKWTKCSTMRLNVDDCDLNRELEDVMKYISMVE